MIPQYRKGIVREVDGKRGLARVEIEDQDGVVSWWLNVNQELASRSRSYLMPEVGAQVNCLTDERGEEGVILGAFYSDVDVPPTTNVAQIKRDMRGGRVETYDKDSGEYHLAQTAKHVTDIGAAHFKITPDKILAQLGGAFIEIIDGQITLSAGGSTLIIGGGTIASSGNFSHQGNAHFNGSSLRHNDKNVGSDHIHSGVEPGGGTSSVPEN